MSWILALIAFLLGYLLARFRAAPRPAAPQSGATETKPVLAPEATSEASEPLPPLRRFEHLVEPLREGARESTRPEDLERHAAFQSAVDLLASSEFSAEDRLGMAISEDLCTSNAAWAAMARARDPDYGAAARLLDRLGLVPLSFALRYLEQMPTPALNAEVVKAMSSWWMQYPASRNSVRRYFACATANGATDFGDALSGLDGSDIDGRRERLAAIGGDELVGFVSKLQQLAARRVLEGIGRFDTIDAPADISPHAALATASSSLIASMQAGPRLFLVHGERGVGKTVLIQQVLRQRREQGGHVFECTASDLLAGQSYIGQIEERLQGMISALKAIPNLIWYLPSFHELLEKGSHRNDPRGLLDQLGAFFEHSGVTVIGESDSAALAHVLSKRPHLRRFANLIALSALEDPESLELGLHWLGARGLASVCQPSDGILVQQAQALVRQFLPQQAEPGRLLSLLRLVVSEHKTQPIITRVELLAALAKMTGLPIEILDESAPLDLEAVAQHFRQRVMGQDEAVDAIVDRVALLKSGLSDPGRPIGVFLFAGPTGTGKTELAKALASLLFGDESRMIRLDMSEFSGDASVPRLLGAHDREGESRSLLARIRAEPFSVVLLDEFEKAHPSVWDLFLQVFDDGRLSDGGGNEADFRHAIIILTSNAGATIARRPAAGFTSVANEYSRAQVEQALFATFRREFLNRLDRVLVFNPLSRAVLREVAHKELERALQRRGLRDRGWLVEFETSAIEFLLDRGYTPDLGARPLKRAIETELLTPLSRVIVERRAPAGEQFLFVRAAGNRLEVEFVDPEAETSVEPAGESDAAHSEFDLIDAVRDPARVVNLEALLLTALAQCQSLIQSAPWQSRRASLYQRMAEADFWNRPERRGVLDAMERIDRIEHGLRQVEERLAPPRRAPREQEWRSIAQSLWLAGLAIDDVLEARDGDAVLELCPGDRASARDIDWRQDWSRLLEMYLAFAKRRNLRVDTLDQDAASGRIRLALRGLAAFALLQHEAGIHSFEYEDSRGAQRVSLRVSVWRHDLAPPFQDAPQAHSRIVRRYREAPAPLVRDLVRGFRTGRLDRVLAGEFDVMR